MNTGSLNERITRALAFMLRHQPEEFDLELDRFGWGDLEDVVYALQERTGSTVEEEDVAEAIESSDRPRYEIKDGKIRALYGHSIQIDPGEATEPPDELFIGVGSRDASRAEDSGLRSGRRDPSPRSNRGGGEGVGAPYRPRLRRGDGLRRRGFRRGHRVL